MSGSDWFWWGVITAWLCVPALMLSIPTALFGAPEVGVTAAVFAGFGISVISLGAAAIKFSG